MTTTPPTSGTTRSTASERRTHVLEVATREFATRGYEGGSTERIAAAAGISQPYVFRLFGSKHKLFLAVIEQCLDDTLAMFATAAADLQGEAALQAIGEAYGERILANPMMLQLQLVGYASCDDELVRASMRAGYRRLVEYVERVSGADEETISLFFARGMLLNVATSMRLDRDPVDWGTRLMEGCRPERYSP
ncbi:MAG: transcriptional regulator, TetR family [Thermoleophilia bacterium]|nr:transcriptional regulator, TetR family [Thermoleophilia bacterium]